MEQGWPWIVKTQDNYNLIEQRIEGESRVKVKWKTKEENAEMPTNVKQFPPIIGVTENCLHM